MDKEVAKPIAEGSKQSVDNESSITQEQFIAQRLGALKGNQQPTKVEEEKPKEEDVSEKETQKQPESDGKEVLSQVDLSELSDEDIAELAEKGKSGLLKRIAELTAKRKLAEERAAQMEAFVQQQQKKLADEPKVENNPYASIASLEELSKKSGEIEEVIDWATDVLDSAEHLGHVDVVATVDGKELTKAEVKDHLRRAKKARDKFLPAQKNEIGLAEQRKLAKSAFEAQALKEMEWLSSTEDNDVKRQYQAMITDPRIKVLEQHAPDIAVQLPYLLAHASNSMYGRKPIPLETKPAVKLQPPANPISATAKNSRPDDSDEKGVRQAYSKLQDSGSVSDFIAMRTHQISKRK